ncbi:MAG: DUF2357 domain-containing protein [Acutalibacteraceae bacterium]|jgi:hypothetical protein
MLWIDTIEKYLPSVNKVVRNPRRHIENHEEILPIELSRNITAESIKHLAQHTNLISNIEGDRITPSKILNVFKEESFDTYENRFVNTLINRLYIFITKRYEKLEEAKLADEYTCLRMNQEIDVNSNEKLAVSFEMKSSTKVQPEDESQDSVYSRIVKLKNIIYDYQSSAFVAEMSKFPFIKPPVMRTNAILKNPDLRNCLDLWIFIESYDKIGYSIDFIDTALKPDDRYLNELYGLTAIHYALLRYYTSDKKDDLILRRVRRKKAVVPKFVKQIYDEFTTEYNISEVEFKRFMDAQRVTLKKQRNQHIKEIKAAVENALKAEKQYKKYISSTDKKKNNKKSKMVS